MVCRSTSGNSGITSYARLHSGVEDVQVLSMFHEQRAHAPAGCAAPSVAEYREFLHGVRAEVTEHPRLSEARRRNVLSRLEEAENELPDAATFHAWRTIADRSVRARAALNAHYRAIGRAHRCTPAEAEAAFRELMAQDRRDRRNAPRPPQHLAFDTSGLPGDRGTRYALAVLHQGGPQVATDPDAQARARAAIEATSRSIQADQDARAATGADRCPNCQQFAGDDHVCPDGPVPLPAAALNVATFNAAAEAGRPNMPLREGRDRVRRLHGGDYVTSDGRNFGTRFVAAVRHERTLPLDMEPSPEPGSTSDSYLESRLGRHVSWNGRRWQTSNGEEYEDRFDALTTEAEDRFDVLTTEAEDRFDALTTEADLAGDEAAAAPTRCSDCGQFADAGHVCAETESGWRPGSWTPRSITFQETTPAPAAYSTGPQPDCPDCGLAHSPGVICPQRQARENREAAERLAATEAAAARPRRQRTQMRRYVSDAGTVEMMNLSQVREDLRAARAGGENPVRSTAVTVRLTGPTEDTFGNPVTGQVAVVTGSVDIADTNQRRTRTRDRYTVAQCPPVEGSERTLRCNCPQYRATYDCPHLDQAREEIAARLNNREAVAQAPREAVEEVRSTLAGDYDASLIAQQAAREAFRDGSDQVSYANDMTAFQSAWDEAKARIEAGQTRLPYATENATGGLGARVGGRSFGIEIEVDFPEDTDWTAKHRVAQAIYDAGLSRDNVVHGWHHAGRAADARGRRMGGGYSDAPNTWSVEFDRSVDDVDGQRGCEIVSPILYDEPHTWENIRKITEIVEAHGGKVHQRHGLHVNVGAGDFNHTVENHNRLLRMSEAYEDVLIRVAHNPEAGSAHRGRSYCLPNQVPAGGYQRISQAQVQNGHRALVNLQHVPAEGAPITGSTRVEVRVFDGTLDPGRIQANIKVGLGMVNAATRGVDVPSEPERAGTHRSRNQGSNGRARRLRGDEWQQDTATFRQFADTIFSRAEDKAQLVHAFATSRWQAR